MKTGIRRVARPLVLLNLSVLHFFILTAQAPSWVGKLRRADGVDIAFNFDWQKSKGKDIWIVRNASERLRVDSISKGGDSLIVHMPLFESRFSVRVQGDSLTGFWYKRGPSRTTVIPFSAYPSSKRFDVSGPATAKVSGRWWVKFAGDSTAQTVAEFSQNGSRVTGTFLNPEGDDRFLEGTVSHDSLLLSGFDGSHSFFFEAKIDKDRMDGIRYSGAVSKTAWTARFDSTAEISDSSVAMYLKPGQDSLHFSFKDMDGKTVSIRDDRFRNKVVVVQLLGSWCPNCMDETAYLSPYYDKNRSRGFEVVALAYEYTTDWQRSVNSLQKFRRRFNMHYPILITGVAVVDSLRTEKTLPEVTPIKVFPSSIIIDKKGKVRKFDTGFNGPGTGEHYMIYRREFESMINKLLAE